MSGLTGSGLGGVVAVEARSGVAETSPNGGGAGGGDGKVTRIAFRLRREVPVN